MTVRDVPAGVYHADTLTDRPTLSASIANILLNQSPAHAKQAHPRLTPQRDSGEESKFDLGTVTHALLLQGEHVAEVLDFPDFRSKDARQARDEARATGRVPLLAKDWQRVLDLVGAVREQLGSFTGRPGLLTDGKAEQTLIWEEAGVACRARLDWFHDDHLTIDDLKTTAASAHPAVWQRTMLNIGADLQARFYQRAVKALFGVEPEFRFVVVETSPPYAVSVVSPAPSMAALADLKIDHALQLWQRCLDNNDWPAYPLQVAAVDAPAWAENQWYDRQLGTDA